MFLLSVLRLPLPMDGDFLPAHNGISGVLVLDYKFYFFEWATTTGPSTPPPVVVVSMIVGCPLFLVFWRGCRGFTVEWYVLAARFIVLGRIGGLFGFHEPFNGLEIALLVWFHVAGCTFHVGGASLSINLGLGTWCVYEYNFGFTMGSVVTRL